MKYHYPSIAKFQQLVELKDYRAAAKKEYIGYVCKRNVAGRRVPAL